MSLFDDFLKRKCAVFCATEEEQKAFQSYLSERGVFWSSRNDPKKYFPQKPPLFYYISNGYLTYSSLDNGTVCCIVNYPDLAEEISPKEIPSPLALLTSRR